MDALEDVLLLGAGDGEDALRAEEVGALGAQQVAEPGVEAVLVKVAGQVDADGSDGGVVLVLGLGEEGRVALQHAVEVEGVDVQDPVEEDRRSA